MRRTIVIVLAVALLVSGAARPASAAPLACQARASITPPSMTASFQALAAQGTGSYGFHWAFGDGATSSLQNPSHTYSSSGVYSAKLTVTDLGSLAVCSDTTLVFAGATADPECGATASVR